jgi:hypothetical protein
MQSRYPRDFPPRLRAGDALYAEGEAAALRKENERMRNLVDAALTWRARKDLATERELFNAAMHYETEMRLGGARAARGEAQ